MQIVKKLTFSDVGSGPINIGNLTTSCPTFIRAYVGVGDVFNTSFVSAKIIFTDSNSSVFTMNESIASSNPAGYFYALVNSTAVGGGDLRGIFTTLDGTLQVELDVISGTPTQGDCTMLISIEALPLA